MCILSGLTQSGVILPCFKFETGEHLPLISNCLALCAEFKTEFVQRWASDCAALVCEAGECSGSCFQRLNSGFLQFVSEHNVVKGAIQFENLGVCLDFVVVDQSLEVVVGLQ